MKSRFRDGLWIVTCLVGFALLLMKPLFPIELRPSLTAMAALLVAGALIATLIYNKLRFGDYFPGRPNQPRE